MSKLVLFNKPYDVLSQFTDSDGRNRLSNYIDIPNVYPAGRLDRNSEGLLLLTDDGKLQDRIANPRQKLPKTYWVQVDDQITQEALQTLRTGVQLKDGLTKPAKARLIDEPTLWQRDPPVRYRANIPTEPSLPTARNAENWKLVSSICMPDYSML